MLFLPNWDNTLECIDGKPAGIEGRSAVGGSDNHKHTGLPNLQASEPVDDRDLPNFVICQCFFGQRIHLIEGHWFVSFVIQEKRFTVSRVVPDNSFKDDHCPVLTVLYLLHDPFSLDSRANDLTLITLFPHNCFGAAANWRKQSDLVTLPQSVAG